MRLASYPMRPPSHLIFTGGEWCSSEVIQTLLSHRPTVIACDGSLTNCLDRDIVPDVVIGDMDSVGPDVLERFVSLGGKVHLRKEQESHDLSKALVFAEELGCTSCVVVGATGGDREHEWANLLSCASSSLEIECPGEDHAYRFLLPGSDHSIEMEVGQTFSLFAVPIAEDITLTGAQYALEKETLNMGSRGLHNVAAQPTVKVRYAKGRLMLLMHHPSTRVEGRP